MSSLFRLSIVFQKRNAWNLFDSGFFEHHGGIYLSTLLQRYLSDVPLQDTREILFLLVSGQNDIKNIRDLIGIILEIANIDA